MKKLMILAIGGLLTASTLGCNGGLGRMFSCCGRNNEYPTYSSDCCDPCCESYYGGSGMEYGYVPQMGPSPVDTLPTPGPNSAT